jgi:dTDP-4-dehydrorhamnose reductase
MRILILGGTGMLGHKLWQHLPQRFPDTFTLIRGSCQSYRGTGLFDDSKRVIDNIDAMDFSLLEKALNKIRPDFVLNCIGVTKRREPVNGVIAAITLNALLPHKLEAWCRNNNARVINFSTDCVFDGKSGNYTEESPTNAEDIYGRTKALGEVKAGSALTLRSSFIGPELSGGTELLEWFLMQQGTIKGFRKVIYSGFTTLELCRIVEKLLADHPKAHGLYNVSSSPISKFELLVMAKKKMNRDVNIVPDDSFCCDRSLNSSKFRREFNYIPPAWEKMIEELAGELKGIKT